MNERIKQLALQATRQYSPTYYTQEWIQGFAQLIVRECLDVALYGDEFEQARTNIKTLFGVEE